MGPARAIGAGSTCTASSFLTSAAGAAVSAGSCAFLFAGCFAADLRGGMGLRCDTGPKVLITQDYKLVPHAELQHGQHLVGQKWSTVGATGRGCLLCVTELQLKANTLIHGERAGKCRVRQHGTGS